jgi:serine protease
MMKGILRCSAVAIVLAGVPVHALAEDARYIVKFNDARFQAGVAALHAGGGRVVLPLERMNAVAARLPAAAIAALVRSGLVEYVEEDVIRMPMALSDRTLASGEILPYGVQMVQGDLVSSTNAAAKKVCIIDSGYSQQHADLRDATDATITQTASNSGSGTWDRDSCGHGTHVAGTVMATALNNAGVIGVVPGVKLHIVKVFGDDNLAGANCAWTYSSTLVDALNKCEAAGANVISMSLGGPTKNRTEETAFTNAYNRGLLHVAAAGNAGTTAISYPAGYASVISVAAVDANEVLGTFSQRNKDVELAAPGVGVLSTVPWLDSNKLTFQDASSVSGGHVEFSGRSAGITGSIVDGGLCSAVGAWTGMVVLCQRGTVDFNTKVKNVASGGGVAAVIYNNAANDAACGDFVGTMGAGNSSPIPAITTSCAEGSSALARAGQSGTVLSQVSVPGSGYEAWNGTSMATPHVSAVAALVWGCFPAATNQSIRNALTATAKDKGTAGRDNSYGFGIVQAKAAVQSLGASSFCTVSSVSKY